MHRGRIAETRRNGSAEKSSICGWKPPPLLCLAGGVNPAAQALVATLGLVPLPQEGGYFRVIAPGERPRPGGRAAASSIWFLLTADSFSALHRLQSKEAWQFQAGDPVEHVQLDPATGTAKVTVLGFVAEPVLEVIVPGGVWQGARLMAPPGPCGWALFCCVVTPAWDEQEFELGLRPALREKFSRARDWIEALTR